MELIVLEAGQPESFLAHEFDGRVSAISYSSYLVLKDCGVWDNLSAGQAQPIQQIRVVEDDSLFFVHFNHADLSSNPLEAGSISLVHSESGGFREPSVLKNSETVFSAGEAQVYTEVHANRKRRKPGFAASNSRNQPSLLGFMVENRHLRQALYKTMQSLPNITLKTECKVTDFENQAERVIVQTSKGDTFASPLLFAVDGRNSAIREKAGISVTNIPYNQTAIICCIDHETSHEGTAVEKFFPAGPFAVLPMPGNRSAIVWTEQTKDAPGFIQLPDAGFKAELMERLGDYLGEVSLVPGRWSYPLSLTMAHEYHRGRVVLVGDSAHGIHPIAGQGANVGFRDVAVLGELIEKQIKLGMDIGSFELLNHYQRWRRFDASSMALVTHGINKLFSNTSIPAKIMRNLGVGAVNRIQPLKNFLMRDAMGLTGKLPKVMNPTASFQNSDF